MSIESKIKAVRGEAEGDILISPPLDRLMYRQIKEWSSACGTYGMGGPGFFGLLLAQTPTYPEEWLMLRIWGASSWVLVNGTWLNAHPQQYEVQRPLHSNYSDAQWDEFGPLVIGHVIQRFDVHERSFELNIGSAHIQLTDGSDSRPPYPAGDPRVLADDDDLREAWIIAPYPWVRV